MSEKNRQDDKAQATKPKSSRDERLAAELRANLKKRKDHMRESGKNNDKA